MRCAALFLLAAVLTASATPGQFMSVLTFYPLQHKNVPLGKHCDNYFLHYVFSA